MIRNIPTKHIPADAEPRMPAITRLGVIGNPYNVGWEGPGLDDAAAAFRAASLIEELKQAAISLFGEFGGVHFQIGKAYPHVENRDPLELSLLRAIKSEVDPDGRMNPGVLGLN